MNYIINITVEVNHFNGWQVVGKDVFHFWNHFATTNEIQPLLKKSISIVVGMSVIIMYII